MNLSNALTAVARAFAGPSNFTGSEPATRKLPPDRASALPALVHNAPSKGITGAVISSGRYCNANELRTIAPSSKAVTLADFSTIIAAPAAIRIAPKTHARKGRAGIHAGNLGNTRVTKSR